MPIQNSDVAEIFEKVADLLEIEDENRFRVRAYRDAARTVGGHSRSAAEMVEQDEDLIRLSGIGEDLAGKIREMKLGPDPLEPDADTFRERFGGRKGGVKAALMNQQIVAGIGNIYSDEILFQARLRPRSSVVRLDGLHKETNHVLNAAIEWVANPQELPDSFLLPHRREGEGVPTGKR